MRASLLSSFFYHLFNGTIWLKQKKAEYLFVRNGIICSAITSTGNQARKPNSANKEMLTSQITGGWYSEGRLSLFVRRWAIKKA